MYMYIYIYIYIHTQVSTQSPRRPRGGVDREVPIPIHLNESLESRLFSIYIYIHIYMRIYIYIYICIYTTYHTPYTIHHIPYTIYHILIPYHNITQYAITFVYTYVHAHVRACGGVVREVGLGYTESPCFRATESMAY